MTSEPRSASLTAPLDQDFLPVVTSFTEHSAAAHGLAAAEAMKLTLAAEEIFVYLSRISAPGESIRVEALGGGYYAQIKFVFAGRDLDLRVFNLTASPSLDDEAGLAELGLIIASRSVDRFSIADEAEGLGLVLVKEKAYPAAENLEPPAAEPLADYSAAAASPEQVKLFARLLPAWQPIHLYPPDFGSPGKMVDMTSGGEYSIAVATDHKGRLGGGVVWRWSGPRMVECYGPYLFNQSAPEMAVVLIEACLGKIAKSDAVGLICRYAGPELPRDYFEELGRLEIVLPDGSGRDRPCYYRQLQEDPGASVWAHPELNEFLSEQYKRLFFAREIRLTRDEGEEKPAHSVLAAKLDRPQGEATLRPVWPGADIERNLHKHVQVLTAEKFHNLFFEIDLGRAWQADLAPVLLENGFEPRLVLPYAGEADLLLFQRRSG